MKKVFIIGREPAPSYLTNNEIPLIINETKDTEHVSRTHSRLTIDEHQDVFIEDLDSTSGTFVNGLRINHITKVNPHSNITLGKSFQFSLSHPTIQSVTSSMQPQYEEPVYESEDYEYASWGARLGGFILDNIIINILSSIFYYLIIAILGQTPAALIGSLVVFFIIIHFYYAVPLNSGGMTFGKRVAGVKVLSAATGEYPSTGQAWGRYFGYFISSLILWIGFLMPLWTEKKQGLHDMLAGTIVVKT
jgi:uncharacterized RDD family membrane protein YckC